MQRTVVQARDECLMGETCEIVCDDVWVVDCRNTDDFSEVFSVPRIGPVAQKRGLKYGNSYDLRSGG